MIQFIRADTIKKGDTVRMRNRMGKVVRVVRESPGFYLIHFRQTGEKYSIVYRRRASTTVSVFTE